MHMQDERSYASILGGNSPMPVLKFRTPHYCLAKVSRRKGHTIIVKVLQAVSRGHFAHAWTPHEQYMHYGVRLFGLYSIPYAAPMERQERSHQAEAVYSAMALTADALPTPR